MCDHEMKLNASSIPNEIKSLPQWVLWKLEPRHDDAEKMTKRPYQTNRFLAKTNDPGTWTTFDNVCGAVGGFDGVGFVLTDSDPYVALDFDHCIAAVEASPCASTLERVEPKVAKILKKINSYTEISPSGSGIRVIVKAKMPVSGKRNDLMEIYMDGRYVTVTGQRLTEFSCNIEDRQREIEDLLGDEFGIFAASPEKERGPNVAMTEDRAEEGILKKAFRSANGAAIKKLWQGDYSAHPSQSEADLALCSHLAFWLGCEPKAIDAAFRQSGLFRTKWDERHFGDGRTYGEATIEKAIRGCGAVYGERSGFDGVRPGDDGVWPKPIPFDGALPLPEFPIDSIPGVTGAMVRAVSESCQVDAGLPATMVLAALSTSLAGKIRVDLGSHKEQCNVYAAAILGSGNRKSEAVNLIAAPVYEFQRQCQESLAPTIRAAASRRRVLEKRLEKLQKDAANTENAAERDAKMLLCDDVLKEIEEHPVPSQKFFVVDDVTTEALGQLMAENDERMAILSAEGGIFKLISGLYHKGEGNMDLYLKAHAADFWSNNRIGREAKTMLHPTLTMGLAVQPDVIEEIGRNVEFRGRGLSARFLYALCRSRAGYRTRQNNPVPREIRVAYRIELKRHHQRYELIGPGFRRDTPKTSERACGCACRKSCSIPEKQSGSKISNIFTSGKGEGC